MEPGGSLPHSQEPTTCPYPEPAQSSPCPSSHFLKIYFNIILPSTLGFPSGRLPSGTPEVKRSERKVNHSYTSGTEFNNGWASRSTPSCDFVARRIIKFRNKFMPWATCWNLWTDSAANYILRHKKVLSWFVRAVFTTGEEQPVMIICVGVQVVSLHWEREHKELTKCVGGGWALGSGCGGHQVPRAYVGIIGTDRIWSTVRRMHRKVPYTFTSGNLILFIPCVFLQSVCPPTNAHNDTTHA
jgi:hypothetical protein